MSKPAVTVDDFAGLKAVANVLRNGGFNAVPVVSRLGVLVGIISEADLILRQDGSLQVHHWYDSPQRRREQEKAHGCCARDVMTRHPVTTSPETTSGEIAEVMHSHHLKSLPVVDDEGAVVGMISRRDLIGMLTRGDGDIADDIRSNFFEASVDRRKVSVDVSRGVVTLTGSVGRSGETRRLRDLVEQVEGVVRTRLWLISDEPIRR